MKSVLQKVMFCFLLVGFYSCWESASKITDEIEGIYDFQYPRGDYQRLKIQNDSSFVQEFYMDKKSFKNNIPPFYVNKGEWSIEKINKLQFDHWLEYCYMGNPDSILTHPKQVTMLGLSWNKATKDHNGYITIFDETGYYFSKVIEDNNVLSKEK
jgi:hypothetical protein